MTTASSTISIVGLGYIGLPMALLLAKAGHTVQGFDLSEQKVAALNRGELFFDEPGLAELFAEVVGQKTFSASMQLQPADVFIVAVPTPAEQGTADLSYVVAALASIRQVAQPGNLVIIESTIGPRDAVDTLLPIVTEWGIDVQFAYCPERAIPGSTLQEMVQNDRIIGAEDPTSQAKATQLYQSFVTGQLFTTTTTIAASAKVMENTYRAVNIALANEFAQLAEKLDFNVWEAITLANRHPRVQIHQPGPGVGGHCIPVDPWFFVSAAPKPSLIEHALELNEGMAEHIANTLRNLIKEHGLTNPTIGILGYAYKPNVDDARETPTNALIAALSDYQVLISDPLVKTTHTAVQLSDQTAVLEQADVVIIATAHTSYKQLNFSLYPKLKILYDAHNCLPATTRPGEFPKYYLLGNNQPA